MKNMLSFKFRQNTLILSVSVLMCTAVFMTGCSKAADKTDPATNSASSSLILPSITGTTTDTSAAPTSDSLFAVNPITGIQDMDPLNVGKRSVSISINNHPQALPSRGVSLADAIYEFETEGGQTRFLAVFADTSKVPEVGSLRSARIIACDLSAGTNSIFIHYGKNARVPDYVSNNKIDHIDGNDYSKEYDQSVNGQITLPNGIYFWRDSVWRQTRVTEHTAVTNGTNILRAISDLKVSLQGDTPSLFTFTAAPSLSLASGTVCNKMVVYFSQNNDDSTFTYDAKTKLYAKSEYGGDPQIDETNGEQIAVKNVVTIFANIQPHGDTTIDAFLNDGGTGFYASEGKIIEIVWSKNGPHAPIVLKDKDGKVVEVNAGKSYINVVRKSVASRTSWS